MFYYRYSLTIRGTSIVAWHIILIARYLAKHFKSTPPQDTIWGHAFQSSKPRIFFLMVTVKESFFFLVQMMQLSAKYCFTGASEYDESWVSSLALTREWAAILLANFCWEIPELNPKPYHCFPIILISLYIIHRDRSCRLKRLDGCDIITSAILYPEITTLFESWLGWPH